MKYETELKDYFLKHKKQLLSDVTALVNINSARTTPEEGKPFGVGAAACLDKAAEILTSHGFRVRNHDYYALTADLGPKPQKLDILAHLDVVPAGGGWKVTEPFQMKVKDGRIYGRGTADDKGPAMCALYAMQAVRDLKIPLKHGVRLILGSDEECGGSDLKYYYSREPAAEMTFTPDSRFPLINIEKGGLQSGFTADAGKGRSSEKNELKEDILEECPRVLEIRGGEKSNVIPDFARFTAKGLSESDLRRAEVTLPCCGQVIFDCAEEEGVIIITAHGLTAHGSAPERGHNALTALLELIAKLSLPSCPFHDRLISISRLFPYEDFYGSALGVDLEDPQSGKTTLALTMLSGSIDKGISGRFDCRACLAANAENTADIIAEKFRAAGLVPGTEQMYPPHVVDEDSELVQALMESYREVTGRNDRPLAIGGGTYVHGVENGVAFGCADQNVDNRMHGPDEFMEIEQMLKSCEIFAQAIVNICGKAE